MTDGGMVKIRVFLIDDHPHGREGMREIVGSDSSFEIAGEAASGEEAIARIDDVLPDLVLMDINMPGMGGLEATQRLKFLHPALKIVMVTVSDDITNLFEAIKRGAQGYLLKNLAPSAWLEYLRAVAVDEAPMSKELAFRLLKEFSSSGAGGIPQGGQPVRSGVEVSMTTPLTEREKEILERVVTGESNREIAAAFGLSEHTVKNHLKNILQKLHLDNRVQLTRYAFEKGLFQRP
ncbi:response regulator [Paenibacillus radicis (ex Gao et al. 2016)]|uniref:DNA-binding response regulator n=1 Tax=Paenibacillus radicis (ex Gao et al. 2016) TaxID=1737354 RepID=A0A917HFM3_9BACL|nr:response regulator transcription factor [Paenibacillus radicis (ex Gao et al. 2016)]GGG77739.1 DNA-binding response regulator [Paenibacillus radicis (ex Gao et al. 2016)]